MFCLSLTFRFIVSQSRYFAIIKTHKHWLKISFFMFETNTSIFNNISLKTKFKMKRLICNTFSTMIKLLTILSNFCQKTNFSNFVAILISFNHQAKMHLLFIWIIYSLFSIIYFYSTLHFIFEQIIFSSLSFLIISNSSKNIFKMSFTFERHRKRRKRRFFLFLIMFEAFEKFEYELLVFRARVLKEYFQHVSKTSHF